MTVAGTAADAPPDRAGLGGSFTVALATLSVTQLMFLVDSTIVNVSLPDIQRSMRFTGANLEWLVSGYSLTFGGLLLLGGRAGDILGRRRTLLGGLALFLLASLAGGLAPNASWLVACRILQGIGAAAAFPTTLAMIAATFPDGPERRRAIGVFSAVQGSGGAIGFLAGGLITTYLSWRWIMLVNLPIGAFVLLAAPRLLPETPRREGRFDAAGASTGTLGTVLVVYALVKSATGDDGVAHWRDTVVVTAAAAAVLLLCAFVVVERRSRHPLVPLRIFADRARSGAYAIVVLQNSAMFGLFFFLTQFVQRVWGYTPLHTAAIYIPMSGLLVAGTQVATRLTARTGAKPLIIGGYAAAICGTVWLARIGPSSTYLTGMLGPTTLIYAGFGMTTVPLTLAAMARVPKGDSGLASGLFSTSRQVGGAIGLAVLGTVTWGAVASARRGAGSGPDAARDALASGIGKGFGTAAAVTVAALVVALVTVPGGRGGEAAAE